MITSINQRNFGPKLKLFSWKITISGNVPTDKRPSLNILSRFYSEWHQS